MKLRITTGLAMLGGFYFIRESADVGTKIELLAFMLFILIMYQIMEEKK